MKKIQILGTGCNKCNALYRNTVQAIEELGIECELEKIEDIEKILAFGIMMIPGFALDGEVISAGKLLNVNEIKRLLESDS